MKLSKHIHSCLLIEDHEQTMLFDPGDFSYHAHALDIASLDKLDYILITHPHADHCYAPFIKDLLQKFPNAHIITNPAVKEKLDKEHISSQTTTPETISFEPASHEKIWDSQPPQNTAITIFNKLTHPGDSLQFTRTAPILALPLTAPWGSTTSCIEKALALKPKVIISIHDYLWRDEIRIAMYKRLTEFFASKGITFKGLETGEIITV